MTIEEKREFLTNYCEHSDCNNCKLKGDWDNHICYTKCIDIQQSDVEDLNKAIDILVYDKNDAKFEACLVVENGEVVKAFNIDPVNHPSHYCTGKFECIDVMVETQGVEAVKSFCLCNAFKYLYRHNGKNALEDIKKAKWYIDKYIELEEGEN